ncbi:MAG: NAD(P)H-dependent oxidoreductase, partial [Ilumatobacteraceae bacterium]
SADTLIFVYPTWWSTMPAILKGWLERVMVPGVGFVFDASGRVRPGLTHVRRLVGISTYGSPHWYVRLVNDNGRRTISRALRMSTGWRTRTTWLPLYGVDATTIQQRDAFVAGVASAVGRL